VELKQIIREMLKRGMSEGEIRSNLEELGIEGGEQALNEVLAEPKAEAAKKAVPPKPVVRTTELRVEDLEEEEKQAGPGEESDEVPEEFVEVARKKAAKTEEAESGDAEEGKLLFGGAEEGGKGGLFEKPGARPATKEELEEAGLFEEEQAKEAESEEEIGEVPSLAVTRIGARGEESTTSVRKMLGMDEDGEAVASAALSPSEEKRLLRETDAKLDELIALSKSLQDLNKKILETNQKMLLRMKLD